MTIPPRRWFRFSLRTLFVLVTLLCVGIAYHTNRVRQQRQMRLAVEMIERHNGKVIFHHERPPSGTVPKNPLTFRQLIPGLTSSSAAGPINPAAEVSAPRWLRRLLGDDYFKKVFSVTLAGALHSADSTRRFPALTDEEWALLASLTSLEILNVSELPLTDESFRHFRGLTNLKCLHLINTEITDKSMKMIGRFHQLDELMVMSNRPISFVEIGSSWPAAELTGWPVTPSNVTNQGLASIRNLHNLRLLYLNSARITDAGLVHLQGLKKLERLWLAHTNVGDRGMTNLLSLPLKSVNVAGTRVTEEGKELLSTIPTIKGVIANPRSLDAKERAAIAERLSAMTDGGVQAVTE